MHSDWGLRTAHASLAVVFLIFFWTTVNAAFTGVTLNFRFSIPLILYTVAYVRLLKCYDKIYTKQVFSLRGLEAHSNNKSIARALRISLVNEP